ncbi:MAG: ChuX/HutX family heme-like substrate-binding protein [Flavobacteriales bacterium]
MVEKPTSDGTVTSVEAFDRSGELMAMFFGERNPGKPELPAWRELAHALVGGTPPGACSAHRAQKEAA